MTKTCGHKTFGVFFCILLLVSLSTRAFGKDVEYDLYIDYQQVNYSGTPVEAMKINNSIPGPTIEVTEGDNIEIRVHNRMNVETSIHWHGLLLPNREDGVPYLTTPPIVPKSTYIYRFPIIQSGTYWYHSHTGLQEQRGVYGSIVIHSKEKTIHVDREYVLVLSDWTDEDPDEVMRTLKRGSEYYSLKKDSIQSVYGMIQNNAVLDALKRSFIRMPPMDISDVAYDAFLINGKEESLLPANPGEKIRLRIINAGASTYFYMQFAGSPMQVVSADGLDVQPVHLDPLLIAIAETYDIVVSTPEKGKAFEFRATAQDGSGSASIFLGEGEKVLAKSIPKPNLYKMDHVHDMSMHGDQMEHDQTMKMPKDDTEPHDHKMSMHTEKTGHDNSMEMKGEKTEPHHMMVEDQATSKNKEKEMEHSGMSKAMHHDMQQDKNTHKEKPGRHNGMKMASAKEEARPLAPYDHLKSPHPTALNSTNPLREITLTLTGDMERYVWSFDNKVLTETDMIKIRHGENVRIKFVNTTMMHHPIHFHGHFFRVINQHGEYSPLKHTVDIAPMATQVIEFYANEEKDWFLHCHILYHMKAGMARVLHYEGTEVDDDILKARKMKSNFLTHDPWFAWGTNDVLTNMTEGKAVAAATRHTLSVDWEKEWEEEEFEVTSSYGYYVNRFLTMFGGAHTTDEDLRGIAGIHYLLPFLIEATGWVDTEGESRVSLEKSIDLTSRLSVSGESQYDTEESWEWAVALEWTVNKHLSLIGKYHSEYDAGIGLNIRF
ncbi:MAG: multicopper oxidase domain-containing protein [Desulfobulbaceae bacterium]|uniref:Multicopper oxidase domain-containing protein n=1 Tax=Candidatus Desulfobia pelagia TaxID=2841692 RepID=A0A8J6TDP4_9BACT|nr:multicopper oxidase domain-containing protein [Candidatus Desulfobia pelagia]